MAHDVEHQRRRMVATQIAARGIRDEALLDAMREVPRERFVDPQLAEFAYEDSPLPIGNEQTISQPYIVAAMIEAAEVGADDRVFEVGAGSRLRRRDPRADRRPGDRDRAARRARRGGGGAHPGAGLRQCRGARR